MNVAVLLFEGFDELDAVGPYEVFENAADAGADIDVALCTLDATERVTASHGLRVEPDSTLDERHMDLLLVPGGGWTAPDSPGVRREYDRVAVPEAIAAAHGDGVTIASVCTGAMLLSRAGVLDDRPAATHHDAATDLQNAGARVQDARVVDDGDVLTCGGVTAGLDLALYVVAQEFGDDVATAVAREMEYEPSSDVHESRT